MNAILEPDKVITQLDDKFQAIKLIKRDGEKSLLIVIYKESETIKKIITAFITTKIKKYLK